MHDSSLFASPAVTIMIAHCKAAVLVAVCCFGLSGCGSSQNQYEDPPPPEVTVASPVAQEITPFLQKNGETEAVQDAEVRARVTGFVEEIQFQPGQEVNKGDILYKIERDQYEAALNSAKAAVASGEAAIEVAKAAVNSAEAEVKRAGFELKRQQELLRRGAGAQADLDSATADDEAAKAAVQSAAAQINAAKAQKASAEASVTKAQLDLKYTTVQAPISGMISKTDVKTGNLVENATTLATIVSHDQIYANFSINDRELQQYLETEQDVIEKGDELEELDWRKIPVYMGREIDEGFPFEGTLEYVDPEGIQASTGTLGLRGIFNNPAKQLLPGMFVTLRVPSLESYPALLIPEYALGRDQRGIYVLTIDSESKVKRTGVTVYKTYSGWAVITDGLTADSKIVIEGIQRARPGLKVAPIERKLSVDRQMLLRGISATSGDSEITAEDAQAGNSPSPEDSQQPAQDAPPADGTPAQQD